MADTIPVFVVTGDNPPELVSVDGNPNLFIVTGDNVAYNATTVIGDVAKTRIVLALGSPEQMGRLEDGDLAVLNESLVILNKWFFNWFTKYKGNLKVQEYSEDIVFEQITSLDIEKYGITLQFDRLYTFFKKGKDDYKEWATVHLAEWIQQLPYQSLAMPNWTNDVYKWNTLPISTDLPAPVFPTPEEIAATPGLTSTTPLNPTDAIIELYMHPTYGYLTLPESTTKRICVRVLVFANIEGEDINHIKYYYI